MLIRRLRLLPLLLPLLLGVGIAGGCRDTGVGPGDTGDPGDETGRVFTYRAPGDGPEVQTITLRGGFNDWGETPLARQADGSFRVVVDLTDGSHPYKFFINGAWPQDMCYDETWGHPAHDYWIDPGADGCESDGHGGQNAIALVGEPGGLVLSHQPGTPAHVSVAGGRLSIRFRVTRDRVTAASVIVGGEGYPMHLQLRTGAQEVWRGSVGENTTSYRLSVTTSAGTTEHGPYSVPAALFRAVPWVGTGIGYQIFPERFWNGDPSNDQHAVATDAWHFLHPSFRHPPPVLTEQWNGPLETHHCCHQYFGGDLAGVAEKLGHLEELGVTLVYLNPIFLSGSAHGYDTFDYLQIAPNFGDDQTLRALMEDGRARGIRLMWDFVPNHVGVGHWAFQDAVDRGTESPTWDWFRFHVPASQVQVGNGQHYDGWWGIGSLPELVTTNGEVHQHLMDVVRHWTEFGLDAIRVDVPESIRNPRQFFPAFRQAAKSVNPEVYLIGEVWGRSPGWLQGDEFDSLMNYAIGLEVIRAVVVGSRTPGAAVNEMALLYADYPEASTAMQFNIISSHDTSRLLTLLQGGTLGMTPSSIALARPRLASPMLYALPGMPVTFQGDECAFLGAAGNRDEHRYPVQWDACDPVMLAHYQRLAGLKRELPALHSPVIRLPTATGPVISFHRGEPGAGEVLALFNTGNDSRSADLPAGSSWQDALGGDVLSGSVPLEALGWRYLERR